MTVWGFLVSRSRFSAVNLRFRPCPSSQLSVTSEAGRRGLRKASLVG
jgi:hypothetical protein